MRPGGAAPLMPGLLRQSAFPCFSLFSPSPPTSSADWCATAFPVARSALSSAAAVDVPHVAALVLTSVRANQNQSLRACIWWSAGIRAFPDAYKRDGRQFFKHGIRMRKRHLRVA